MEIAEKKTARPLRFVVAWGNYRVGDIIGAQADNPVPGTLRDELLSHGFVVPHTPVIEVKNQKPFKNQNRSFKA